MASKKLVDIITIPLIEDDGQLCFAEIDQHLPFLPKRVYYILNPKPQEPRGYHAHKKTDQLLFCIQGSVKMVLDNGRKKEQIVLNKPNIGIMLPQMIWHEMHNMDKDTILLVLASKKYEPADYIRSYDQFMKLVKKK